VSTTGSSDNDETSKLKKMKPHVPGIVIFADHNRPLPWSVTYHAVTLFADISGIFQISAKCYFWFRKNKNLFTVLHCKSGLFHKCGMGS
jgi:hypothetical protein